MMESNLLAKLKRLGGPLSILQAAVEAVPAVKYALGIAGVAAALAIVTSLFSSIPAALLGIAVMLPLMVLLIIVSAITGLAGSDTRVPALVFTWAVLVLFVGSATLLAGTVFFDWPRPVNQLIGFMFSKKGISATSSSNPSAREEEAQRMYDYALAMRKGRGDAGLKDSMEIFRRIGREYPETAAARDALDQLRASEELEEKLGEVRQRLRDALEGRPPIEPEPCPSSVTYDLCRRLEEQDLRVTLRGTLSQCSFDDAQRIVNECAAMVKD